MILLFRYIKKKGCGGLVVKDIIVKLITLACLVKMELISEIVPLSLCFLAHLLV